VITRYNRSILYAMAIHDLAMAIETELARAATSEAVGAASGSPR
jgi:hypothetical protein